MIIPDYILQTSEMSESELKQEIAVTLFQQNRLNLTQASDYAEMNRYQFRQLLASRQIPVDYDLKDFQDDMKTLKKMGKL